MTSRRTAVAAATLTALTTALTPALLVPPAAVAATPVGVLRPLAANASQPGTTYAGNWAVPDRTALYRTTDGQLGAISVNTAKHVVRVDTYDAATYARTASQQVADFADWPVFGGVWTAPDGHHFVLVGRANPRQSTTKKVIAVRRYAPDWTPAGTATLPGGLSQGFVGVVDPFDSGAAKMTQVGDQLVVHASRTLFADDQGDHHQSALTFAVDLGTMKARTFEDLGIDAPTISHSFNQLVAMVGDDLVFVDQGDAYPRGVIMSTIDDYPASTTIDADRVLTVPGGIENFTGVELGGLGAGPQRALVVGASQPQEHPVAGVRGNDESWSKNVFVVSVDPDTDERTFRWLTELDPRGRRTVTTPRLTQVGPDRFALLFGTQDGADTTLEYRLLDSAGETLATRTWDDGWTSATSEPLLVDDRLLWPGIDRRSGDAFLFGLDLADPTAPTRLGNAEEVLSSEARLRSVKVIGGTLSSTFSANKTTYTVRKTDEWLTFRVALVSRVSTVAYHYSDPGWSTGNEISVAGGGSLVFRVTAEDGTRKRYTFKIR